MKIDAAVARAHGAKLVIEALDLDDPRADEILVRLVASGVSGVDRQAVDGTIAMPLPFVPGCEGAGIVERVGDDVTGLATGDAVVIGRAACGYCERCVAGQPLRCVEFAALNLSGRRRDGSSPLAEEHRAGEVSDVNGFFYGQSSFATHVLCRAESAIKLPAGAPLELLAVLGGDLLAAAALIDHGFQLQTDDSLVVTGADAVGLFAVMLARARGAGTIIVIDPDDRRHALASECGATVCVHTGDNLMGAVMSMVEGGAQFALDTTGDDDTRRAAFDSLAPGGLCGLIEPPCSDTATGGDELADGKRLMLSASVPVVPRQLVRRLARLLAAGELPLEKLITFYPFERVNDALEAQADGGAIKPVLRFSLGSFGDLDRAESKGAADQLSGPAPEPEPDPSEKDRAPPVPVISA